MYVRKTRDVYIMMSNYGYGLEEELEENTYAEAKNQVKTYYENCKNAEFKIIKKRVPINQ